jgi:hypothetical protein
VAGYNYIDYQGGLETFRNTLRSDTVQGAIAELRDKAAKTVLPPLPDLHQHGPASTLVSEFTRKAALMNTRLNSLLGLVNDMSAAADDIARLYDNADGEAAAQARANALAIKVDTTLQQLRDS